MGSRRDFLTTTGLLGLGLFAGAGCTAPRLSRRYLDRHFIASNKLSRFPKLEITPDRVVKETVGLRPFRRNGFRVDKEILGEKTIVHNYGHGGSGWSLSWGTGKMAAQLAATTGEREIAVMGSGVVGLTTARILQGMGFDVTIYTKALPPQVTSSRATGTWSPSFTLIDKEFVTPEFEATWQEAARLSFRTYQNLLGMNDIVTWIDEYTLRTPGLEPPHDEALAHLRIDGLLPERKLLSQKEHPFKAETVSKQTTMVFNIPSYLNKHINDFIGYGGKVIIRTFQSLADIHALEEKCVVNCTGLGAGKLFNDENVMPFAGQLAFLIPQPEFNYRITTPNGYAIPRKDGIVLGGNSIRGSWNEIPDPAQTAKVVNALMDVMKTMHV